MRTRKSKETAPKGDSTEIIVLLDRSGSMAAIKTDMQGGYDSFIAEQRKLPGECAVTLVQFDSEGVETVYESRPVAEVPPLVLAPRGTTPLLDAMGQTLTRSIDRKLEGRVLFLVITDGQENASHEFKKDQIKTMVQQQTTAGWAFSFLGANVDAFAEAGALGIDVAGTANFVGDAGGVVAAFASLGEATTRYRDGAVYKISDEERKKMGPAT